VECSAAAEARQIADFDDVLAVDRRTGALAQRNFDGL
jgi:hypothetical protein